MPEEGESAGGLLQNWKTAMADKRIDASTRCFAVLGHPVEHSLSPLMHNAAFRELGMAAVYLAFDVRPENLDAAVRGAAAMGFGGLNLTVPLKEAALGVLDELDESARTLGAVNTVEISTGGLLRGHNTDGEGFLAAFREAFGFGPKGRRIFVLGTGGAGRAVALSCAAAGAHEMFLCDADKERAVRVAAEINDHKQETVVSVVMREQAEDAAREADIVIQATPVGLRPEDESPLSGGAFREGQAVFDLVYTYPETAFMRKARSRGAEAVNGLGMLLHQGARAFAIWTGRDAPVDVMRAELEAAVYGT